MVLNTGTNNKHAIPNEKIKDFSLGLILLSFFQFQLQ